MQQRLQIARNLVTGPRLVFMDEPTGGLDVSVQARLLDLLRGLVREMGLSAIIVTHDLAVVRLLADRLMVMKSGRVVEQGLTDQVLDDPAAWLYAASGILGPAGLTHALCLSRNQSDSSNASLLRGRSTCPMPRRSRTRCGSTFTAR